MSATMQAVKQQAIKTIKTPLATAGEVAEYVAGHIPAPSDNFTANIDTSDIDLFNYRVEDADINAIYNDAGWSRVRLVDEAGQTVPNARLEITHKSGNKHYMVPFFPAVLLARKSTVELTRESQLDAFCKQGSMKQRGNTFKFIMSEEQRDALQAKAQLQWELDVKATTAKFQDWLGSYHPVVAVLPALYDAFQSGAMLVLLDEQVFVRQVIPATSEALPLENDRLNLVTSTPDLIGDYLVSTCHTYQLSI